MRKGQLALATAITIAVGACFIIFLKNRLPAISSEMRLYSLRTFEPDSFASGSADTLLCGQARYLANSNNDTVIVVQCPEFKRLITMLRLRPSSPFDSIVITTKQFSVPFGMGVHESVIQDFGITLKSTAQRNIVGEPALFIHANDFLRLSNNTFSFSQCKEFQLSLSENIQSYSVLFRQPLSGRISITGSDNYLTCMVDFTEPYP